MNQERSSKGEGEVQLLDRASVDKSQFRLQFLLVCWLLTQLGRSLSSAIQYPGRNKSFVGKAKISSLGI